MRSAWMLLICLLCLPAVGHARPKQVYFDDEMRNSDEDLAFYMDRHGDLYPPGSVSLNMKYFLNVKNGPRPEVLTSDSDFARLKSLYAWKAGLGPMADGDWPALLEHTGVDATGDFDADWAAVQTALRADVAQRISTLGREYDDVVLMIHGYNNEHGKAKAWYRKAEDSMRKAGMDYGRRIVFVRMYWDGLHGFTPFFVWSRAQYNGYLVGLELRRVLQQVDADTPLRVFTHSSGAYVITNAMGDASAGAQFDAMPGEYHRRAAGTADGYAPPTHLRDVRVAMLVPAQPSTAFRHYLRNPATGRYDPQKRALVPQRLILGVSKRDSATNKFGVIPCRWKGATCMAVQVRQSCRCVARSLGIAPPQLMAVNFAKQGLIHPHSVEKYMDDAEWPELTHALLAPDPGMPTATPGLCTLRAADADASDLEECGADLSVQASPTSGVVTP